MNQEVLLLADAQHLVESHTFSWWQKYINGINLTYIDCNIWLDNCTLPRKENTFYMVTHKTNTEYMEVDDEVGYYCSLIAPVLMAVGSLVNYSTHLYVARGDYGIPYFESVRNGKITSVDRVPQLYHYETQNEALKFNCSKPLYISNQLSMISVNVKKELQNTLDLWKTFDMRIWVILLSAFLFVVIAEKLISIIKKRNANSNSLYNIMWIYIKPLIGIGESFGNYNLIYILWLFSIFPLTEIFKNELLVNLVSVQILHADNIDDLLDDRLPFVYTDRMKHGAWKDGVFSEVLGNEEQKKKFKMLFEKAKAYDSNKGIEHWKELFDKPQEFRAEVEKSALINDDQSIEFFKSLLGRFFSVHSGEESYFSQLITPLCYGPDFKFVKETEEVSLRLFESSLFGYWNQVKVRFFTTVGIRLIEMYKGGDALSKLYGRDKLLDPLNLAKTKSLFFALSLCLLLHILVFCIENIYFVFKK